MLKDIKNFEGYYQIDENGNIYSLRTNKYLKLNYKDNGYIYIELNVNGIATNHRVHRLVAEAFIDNPLNLPYVNHKDGNKSNNNVNNLEWCNASDNTLHAYEKGLAKSITNKYEIYQEGNLLKICNGIKEVQDFTGIKSHQTVRSLVLNGKPSRFGKYVIVDITEKFND